MEDFALFDLLPNGLLVFKNKKIEYINQHILELLNISFLSKENAIEILLKTMDISTQENLYLFFAKHNYFDHNGKVVQIEHSVNDDLDIFSFMLINSSLLKTKQSMSRSKKINIDQKIAEHFKIKNISKVGVLTLYKGLPLKSIGEILRINSDSIEIIIDSKHKISLHERDDIILIMNKKRDFSVLHGYVAKNHNDIFTINNFTLTKDNMHLRNSIRIKPELDMSIVLNKENYSVYDISKNGISIKIDNKEDEEILKNTKSMNLFFCDEKIHINVEYLKTVYDDSGDIIKIIFFMFNTKETLSFIDNYLMDRQNEIIKEIHTHRKQEQNKV